MAAAALAAGDAVGKGLALLNQIRKSPQAQAFFAKTCSAVDVPVLQLLGWVRTRWASLYAFLDRILLLQKAVNQFASTADETQNKADWVKITLMHEVLQEPAKIQQSFSSAKFPTVWRTVPLLEFLQQSWMNMAAHSKFASMASSINAGLENLEKWYRKTDETDIAVRAMDPNYKTAYAEHNWASEFFDEGMAKMEAKFDSYYTPPAVALGGPEPGAHLFYTPEWWLLHDIAAGGWAQHSHVLWYRTYWQQYMLPRPCAQSWAVHS
ncbi:hypothetical protein FB451DRAFT_1179014 [Mycena latifolia]|nr:hypothetical protein FB451DRAFT_1179014 [Mycena latifolia]